MMESVFDGLRWVHIVVGFTGLAAFWVPAFAKKGGRLHVRAGRVFEFAAYVVAGSAIFNAIGRLTAAVIDGGRPAADPAGFGFAIFLAYLGLVTLASVRHAVRSVQAKKDYTQLRTPFHFVLAVTCIIGTFTVVGYALFMWSNVSIVLLALSPIGVQQGVYMLKQMTREPSERMAWFYSHMGNMIGAGIAFHTAFAVFGAGRIFGFQLPGFWQVVPWLLPAMIGIPANAILERRYREKFGEPKRPRGRAASGATASA